MITRVALLNGEVGNTPNKQTRSHTAGASQVAMPISNERHPWIATYNKIYEFNPEAPGNKLTFVVDYPSPRYEGCLMTASSNEIVLIGGKNKYTTLWSSSRQMNYYKIAEQTWHDKGAS